MNIKKIKLYEIEKKKKKNNNKKNKKKKKKKKNKKTTTTKKNKKKQTIYSLKLHSTLEIFKKKLRTIMWFLFQ